MSQAEKDRTSAEAAVSLVELLSPEALLPHLHRLEAAVERVRKIRTAAKGSSAATTVARTTRGTATAAAANNKRGSLRPLNDVRGAVLNDLDLLGRILDFEGSLAFYHNHYDTIVGYTRPNPRDASELHLSSTHRVIPPMHILRGAPGTCSNVLVCKKWKSMVMGKDGEQHLKALMEDRTSKKICIAKDVARDSSLTWTVRLCAMAVCDDVDGLKKAFRNKGDESQGIGAAIKEQGTGGDYSDDYDDFGDSFEPLPRNHPFYPYCITNLIEDSECDNCQDDFTVSIAYAAALAGSLKALRYLDSLAGPLWNTYFNQKGDGFLGDLLEYACHRPLLDGPVASVRTLLSLRPPVSGSMAMDNLHLRHRGTTANHLHLAAGRGHKSLVEALVAGGMDPSRPCEAMRLGNRIDRVDPRNKGIKELPLPEDWAEVRGHSEVCEFLRTKRRELRPDLRVGYEIYHSGKLERFFPSEDRQYGFINPGGVFVHLNKLREFAVAGHANGFPVPGQKLCFTVSEDRRGRKRAEGIMDGNDFSYLRLPLDRSSAYDAWYHYDEYGSDYDEDEEEDVTDEDDDYVNDYGGYDDDDQYW